MQCKSREALEPVIFNAECRSRGRGQNRQNPWKHQELPSYIADYRSPNMKHKGNILRGCL